MASEPSLVDMGVPDPCEHWDYPEKCKLCELNRLRDAVSYLRLNAVQTHGSDPYVYLWQRAWQEFERRVDGNGFCRDRSTG